MYVSQKTLKYWPNLGPQPLLQPAWAAHAVRGNLEGVFAQLKVGVWNAVRGNLATKNQQVKSRKCKVRGNRANPGRKMSWSSPLHTAFGTCNQRLGIKGFSLPHYTLSHIFLDVFYGDHSWTLPEAHRTSVPFISLNIQNHSMEIWNRPRQTFFGASLWPTLEPMHPNNFHWWKWIR